MQCRDVRWALLDCDLDVMAAGSRVALAEHLERCAACSAASRLERSLTHELTLLQGLERPAVDVAARVMAEIGGIDRVGRALVSGRQLAWASLAATVAALGLLAGTIRLWPTLVTAAAQVRLLSTGLGLAAWQLGRAVLRLAQTPLQAIETSSSLSRMLSAGAAAGPYLQGTITISFVAIIAITSYVVTRDLRQGRVPVRGAKRGTLR